MKSLRRIEAAAKSTVDQINELPTQDIDLNDPSLRAAFIVYETLQWALGKRELAPEARVSRLLDKYRERHSKLPVVRP